MLHECEIQEHNEMASQTVSATSTAQSDAVRHNALLAFHKKIRLALEIGQLRTHYSSWLFTAVYLLYAGTTSAVFDMFKCRTLDDAASFLQADMQKQCTEIGGQLNSTYFVFQAMAVGAMMIYPIGIPAALGFMLSRQRETVQRNPDYVTLVAFKPLFQFCA